MGILESIPDLAWGILLKKGIQDRYETYLSDAMPKPKKEYLVPVFDHETWDSFIQAILEAAEIWKAGVIKLAKEPEPGPAIKKSDFEQWNLDNLPFSRSSWKSSAIQFKGWRWVTTLPSGRLVVQKIAISGVFQE